MIIQRKFSSLSKYAEFFRGTPVASGTLGTNGAGSPTITVPAASGSEDDFTDVLEGDRVYISGELSATVFLVTAGPAPTSITLDNNIVAAHTADAVWRVTRGGIDPSLVIDQGFEPTSSQGYVLYESDTFGV